jgi:uncharacterized protein YbdZ (MbtH family)
VKRDEEEALRTVILDSDSPEARFKVLINHDETWTDMRPKSLRVALDGG